MKLKIAFFGSPGFVVPILGNLYIQHGVRLVVSQPDRPIGRKKIISPTPVKSYAVKHTIPVETDLDSAMSILQTIDLVVVAAYGQIISKELLLLPKFGCINVHFSLLPKYRGASPVQEALLQGDTLTGVTIMRMDEELDHGEIISQKELPIDINDTSESLLKKLTELSIPLLNTTIEYIKQNNKLPDTTAQNHHNAVYCKRITKQDGFVDFQEIKRSMNNEQSARMLHDKIRAYYPWPIVWTILPDTKRVKILKSNREKNVISLDEIQIEGKKRTTDSKLIHILFNERIR